MSTLVKTFPIPTDPYPDLWQSGLQREAYVRLMMEGKGLYFQTYSFTHKHVYNYALCCMACQNILSIA